MGDTAVEANYRANLAELDNVEVSQHEICTDGVILACKCFKYDEM